MKEALHTVTLVSRESLTITEVKAIQGFDEGYVKLDSELGVLIVEGEGLEIEDLSSETRTIRIKGKVSHIEYKETKKRAGLFGKG